jgi:hypothetical protein
MRNDGSTSWTGIRSWRASEIEYSKQVRRRMSCRQVTSEELLAIRHWPITALGSKFVVVAYREVDRTDGFVLTAYLARRLSRSRVVIWKR